MPYVDPSDVQLVLSGTQLQMRFLYPAGNAPPQGNHPTNPSIGNGVQYTGSVYARIAPVGSPPAFSAPFTSGWTNISTPVGGAAAPFGRASDGTWIQSSFFMNIIPSVGDTLRRFFNGSTRIGQDMALYVALSHTLNVQDHSSGSLQHDQLWPAGRLPFKYVDWTDGSFSQSLSQSDLTVQWDIPVAPADSTYPSNSAFPTSVPVPADSTVSYPPSGFSSNSTTIYSGPQLYYNIEYRQGSNWEASPGSAATGVLLDINTVDETNTRIPADQVPPQTYTMPDSAVTNGFQLRYRPVLWQRSGNGEYSYIPSDWQYTSQITGDVDGPVITITSPSTNATQGSSVTFSGTFSDVSGVATMSADVVPPSGSTFSPAITFTPGTSGSWNSTSSIALTQSGIYQFRITATDTQGNSTTETQTVGVGVATAIEITSPATPPDEFTGNPGNITISGTWTGKNPDRVDVRIENESTGVPQTITIPGSSLTNTGEGGAWSTIANFPSVADYTVTAEIYFPSAEVSNPPQSVLIVHIVAPEGPGITVNVPTEGYVATENFTAHGTFPNPGDVVSAYFRRGTSTSSIPVGGSTWNTTIPFSFLNDGVNSFIFAAVDAQGNETQVTRNVQKVYPPTVHITQPVDTDQTDTYTTVINQSFTVSGSYDLNHTNPIQSVAATRTYNSSTTVIPGVTYDSGTGAFSFPLSVSEVGEHLIIVTVADNQGISRTDSFTVNATAQNNPPTVNITKPNATSSGGNGTYTMPAGGTYELEGTFADDLGVTRVRATVNESGPNPQGPQDAGDMVLIPGPGTSGVWRHPNNPLTLSGVENGITIWTLTAEDTLGAVASVQVNITGTAVNTPPTVTVTSPASSPHSHEALTPILIEGTFNDDTQVTSMACSITGPSSAVYNPSVNFSSGASGNWTISFTPTEVGAHSVVVTALDNESAVGQATFTLDSIDTTGPALGVAIPTESQVVNDAFISQGTVSDASTVVSITLTNNRLPGDSLVLNTPSSSWQLNIPTTFLVEGSNTLTFVAEDSLSNVSQVVRTITYSPITANVPPDPTPVTATGTDTTEITVIWPVTAFADTWAIERREEPGGTPGAWSSLSTTLTANQYIDTGGLDPQGVYRYRVKAFNTVDTEESAWVESNLIDLGETAGTGAGYGYVVIF